MDYVFSEQIKFLPWIGSQYESGLTPGVRLLILGESHHGEDPTREFTRQVVQAYLDGEAIPFFTIVHQVVAGIHHSDDNFDKVKFWSSVAFYNFVQVLAGNGPRQRPKTSMYRDSYPAFREVLSQLRPTHLLALGWGDANGLWPHMPPFDGGEGYRIAADDKVMADFGRYQVNDNKTIAMGIEHPVSGGFSSGYWQPVVEAFLRLRAK